MSLIPVSQAKEGTASLIGLSLRNVKLGIEFAKPCLRLQIQSTSDIFGGFSWHAEQHQHIVILEQALEQIPVTEWIRLIGPDTRQIRRKSGIGQRGPTKNDVQRHFLTGAPRDGRTPTFGVLAEPPSCQRELMAPELALRERLSGQCAKHPKLLPIPVIDGLDAELLGVESDVCGNLVGGRDDLLAPPRTDHTDDLDELLVEILHSGYLPLVAAPPP
ncbi:hypothetical protein QN239_31620 [Mycolicibacterium sp. Y3]